MPATTEEYSTILTQHGIRPSVQRQRILAFLMNSKDHPAADDVYQALHPEIASLSKTTVYNTLNLLVREHLAREVSIQEGELRYDGDVTPHGHFRCIKCGKILDFPVDYDQVSVSGLEGCLIETRDIYFQGICKDCIGK